MKPYAFFVMALLTAAPARAAEPAAGLKTEDQKTLYAVGVWLGGRVGPLGLKESELKYVSMGLKDSVLGRKPQIDLNSYMPKINELAQKRMTVKAVEQKKKDKPFLDKAAKEPGAATLPSGLIFTEVKAGTGDAPKASDTIRAAYEGRMTNGTVFDSSEKHGGPVEFALDRVIPCWTEAFQKIKLGGKAKLVCPGEIAYGDGGNPAGNIPGGATLIFDVELVEIVNKTPAEKPVEMPAEPAKKSKN